MTKHWAVLVRYNLFTCALASISHASIISNLAGKEWCFFNTLVIASELKYDYCPCSDKEFKPLFPHLLWWNKLQQNKDETTSPLNFFHQGSYMQHQSGNFLIHLAYMMLLTILLVCDLWLYWIFLFWQSLLYNGQPENNNMNTRTFIMIL
jgi:hypothetical protein